MSLTSRPVANVQAGPRTNQPSTSGPKMRTHVSCGDALVTRASKLSPRRFSGKVVAADFRTSLSILLAAFSRAVQ